MTRKECALLCVAIDKILADGDTSEFDEAMIILCKLAKRRIKPINSGTAVPLIEVMNMPKRKFGVVKS